MGAGRVQGPPLRTVEKVCRGDPGSAPPPPGIWGSGERRPARRPPGSDDTLSPAGLAYSNLVYDWVKAAVLFGVVNTVARLDHLDPPQPPKCITALYVFAET